MIVYLVVLGLGLSFLYTLRDGVLALQREHDRKLLTNPDKPDTIIAQNCEQCKQIKRAG